MVCKNKTFVKINFILQQKNMKNSYDLLLFCLIFLLFNIFSTQQVIIADNFNLNDVEKLSDTEDAVISIENINIISPTELEIVFTDNVDISRASFFLLDMDYTLKVYPTSDPKFIKGIVSPALVNNEPGCVLYHNVKDLYGNLIPQGVYVFTVILDTDIKEPSDPTEPVNPSEPTDPVIPDKPLIDDDTLVVDDIPDTDDQPVVTPEIGRASCRERELSFV